MSDRKDHWRVGGSTEDVDQEDDDSFEHLGSCGAVSQGSSMGMS